MQFKKIEGLIAPVFTPLTQNGDLNLDIIEGYAQNLIKKGLSGIFVLGSSGEGLLLSTKERKAVVERWSRHTNENFKMIVHVGATSYREAQELAKHACENGAFAISSMGPSFLQPKRVEELITYCYQIASVVPELPFYYYHIPVRSGISVNMFDFLKSASEKIPNLAGIKYTDSNFMEMQQCLAFAGNKFDILYGSDASLICGLVLGIKGGIGTTYNFIPNVYDKMIEAFNKKDILEARKHQFFSVQVNDIIARYGGGIIAGKVIEKMIGIDCGPCRAPLKNLAQTEVALMQKELESIGFFEKALN
jgi:N-acetylneuraminate lyase